MQPESTQESFDFDNFVNWLYANRTPVAIGGAILAVALAGFAIFNWKKTQNELDANAALFALPTLVGAHSESAHVSAQDFQKIADQFPSTGVADRAEIIAAGLLFTEGKYAEAEKQFAKILGETQGSPLQSEAALGVAASLEAQGKVPEAIAKYQELIAKYPGDNVVRPAKLTLARLFETQNKPEEALKLYDDLTRNPNPYDPWSAEARERRELLVQKFPNLKSTTPIAAPEVSTSAPVAKPSAPSSATNPAPAK